MFHPISVTAIVVLATLGIQNLVAAHGGDEIQGVVDNYRYESWSSWGDCYGPCGTSGFQMRTRKCHNIGGIAGQLCEGACLNDYQTCTPGPCPVNGVWSTWSAWGACSQTCDIGFQTRTRTCDGQMFGGHSCCGPDEEERPCKIAFCYADTCVDNTPECESWSDNGFCHLASVREACPEACSICDPV